ncbi:hypothetical protein OIU74_008084 [Salix koriyanagi]|uniref:Uncharacterized protein n=1 Tax=Salix koriyanagi TaxID=2511006 RepID=A0A9Q0U543_9ROSI|nr:hypothetical protein OIU74_008084 [Salix koriyanagi]
MHNSITIEPLPGLESIVQELVREDGIDDIRISRQGFEKRVVSQDLQLWLSNAPPINRKFTLLARAGRQVQEIQMTTTLDQDGKLCLLSPDLRWLSESFRQVAAISASLGASSAIQEDSEGCGSVHGGCTS